jgi:hypothetical protein
MPKQNPFVKPVQTEHGPQHPMKAPVAPPYLNRLSQEPLNEKTEEIEEIEETEGIEEETTEPMLEVEDTVDYTVASSPPIRRAPDDPMNLVCVNCGKPYGQMTIENGKRRHTYANDCGARVGQANSAAQIFSQE